jgi:hypothetical protein
VLSVLFLLAIVLSVLLRYTIQFSDEPSYADEGCTNNTLIHASASNKRRMLEKVKNIRPERRANFTKALIEAFELFMSVG